MATAGPIENEFNHLYFGIARSVRYHIYRQNFFNTCHTWVLLIAFASSTATLAAFVEILPRLFQIIPSVITSIVVAIDIVVRVDQKAMNHRDLRNSFVKLQKRMEKEKDGILSQTEGLQVLRDITSERLSIETKEPGTKIVLDSVCHNELVRTMGHAPSNYVKIGFLQRCFKQWFDLQSHKLRVEKTV